MLKVELIYAPEVGPFVHLHLSLKSGASVADALEASGVFNSHPETKTFSIGIYSKQVSLNHLIKSGDRIEIYRPLSLDPKDKRRQKAKHK